MYPALAVAWGVAFSETHRYWSAFKATGAAQVAARDRAARDLGREVRALGLGGEE